MKSLLLVAMVILLSACGADINGTYTGKGLDLTFKSNGKVSITSNTKMSDKGFESPYHVDGEKITFNSFDGLPISFRMNKDGSLDGGVFGQFTKK
jgi:hypothetical protein